MADQLAAEYLVSLANRHSNDSNQVDKLPTIASCHSGDFNQTLEISSLIDGQSGTLEQTHVQTYANIVEKAHEHLIYPANVIDQTEENQVQADAGFSHAPGSLLEISHFAEGHHDASFVNEHQGTAFYITTDENSALPAEILLQGTEKYFLTLLCIFILNVIIYIHLVGKFGLLGNKNT